MPIKRNNITDEPIFFNPVGEQILLGCGTAISKEELSKSIIAMYGIEDDLDSVKAVNDFIEELITKGIITE